MENSTTLEICSSNTGGVGQLFKIRALLHTHKPLHRCILVYILGSGKVKTSVQYERLPTFCFFCGCIDHIFNRCTVLKNSQTQYSLSCEEFPYSESLCCSDKLDTSFMEKLAPSPGTSFVPTLAEGLNHCHTNVTTNADAKTSIQGCSMHSSLGTLIPSLWY